MAAEKIFLLVSLLLLFQTQNSDILPSSCSGVDEPNACLTYDIAADELVLYIEAINPSQVIWVGRGSTIDEAYER